MIIVAKGFQDFNVKNCLELYNQKRYDKLCQDIFAILKHCHEVSYSSFSRDDLKRINAFVQFVFFLLAQEDFRFPDNWIPLFVNVSHLFANLVTISAYQNSDGVLRAIMSQEGNYAKLLFLFTCRNQANIDFKALITPNPKLATIWWNNFSVAPPGSTSEHTYTCMLKHLVEFPTNLELPDTRVQPTYFQSSYFGINERPIKEWYNKQIQKITSKLKVVNRPRKGRIAIITDKWISTTAVYKSSYPQIAALAEKYDLTLVTTSKLHMDKVDRILFKRIINVGFGPGKVDLTNILKNDFVMAYFPDIGMTDESVFMSNIKLAPIMVCGYGHPASTYGSLIDYFIGGIDSERADLYQDNYSERLVLIPGLGAHPVDPQYTKRYPPATDKTYINCCWTTAKINWPMLQMLRSVQQTRPNIHYQFFPSWTGTRYNNYPIICRELGELFQGKVTVYPNLDYQAYLTRMEQAAFTIDSHPFGGYNTVVDSFFVGCPVVTIEGTKFYNRASTALARRVGVDLSTGSIEDCEKKIELLLDNPQYLAQERQKLADTERLRKLLVSTDEPQYFVKAIGHILASHPIPGKEPILIQ